MYTQVFELIERSGVSNFLADPIQVGDNMPQVLVTDLLTYDISLRRGNALNDVWLAATTQVFDQLGGEEALRVVSNFELQPVATQGVVVYRFWYDH